MWMTRSVRPGPANPIDPGASRERAVYRESRRLPLTRFAVAFGAGLLIMPTWTHGGATAARPTREVEIVAHDYSFVAPSALPAGQTIFRFTNEGKVIHELDVSLLKAGTTAQAVMSALNARKPLKPLIETGAGILVARAGHRSTAGLSTQLVAGRNYLLICRFQDSAIAPMHSRMGMIAVVHVTPARISPRRIVRTDTIVGVEYAFKAPQTLTPGHHTLTFINGGHVLHELNVALLRPGVSVEQAIALMKKGGDDSGIVEEWLGVLFAKPGAPAAGQLNVNFLPKRDYVISCGLADNDSAPPHLALGMFGRVRTAALPLSGR
jgi:hypothetical protein